VGRSLFCQGSDASDFINLSETKNGGVQVLVFKQKGDLEWSPFTMKNGEPWRARTSDPLIKSPQQAFSLSIPEYSPVLFS
jgi:hypothetical protein